MEEMGVKKSKQGRVESTGGEEGKGTTLEEDGGGEGQAGPHGPGALRDSGEAAVECCT